MKHVALPLCAALLIGTCVYAQDPPTQQQDPQAQDLGGGRGGPAREPVIRPYDRVITKDAQTKTGVFTVHRIKDRLYYEIPKEQLGREFLWVSQIRSTTLGAGQGGQAAGNRVVRWERRGDRVFLRSVSYEIRADDKSPIARAVHDANYDPIVMSFNIDALGKNDAPVIEVTRLFTTDVPEFSGRSRLRARTFDQSRSFVDRAAVFPTNIEVEAIQTYNNPPDDNAGRGGAPTPAPGGGRGAAPVRPGSASVVMHYSMVQLPEKPMQPRLFDERVGYFTAQTTDYGLDVHKAKEVRYITRYRLEKKDPNAALSEPVKPIVYYIDPATPMKWRPWLKKGIEDWQPAFEAAGFKNAIVAKDPPTPEQDPDWSPEDARYSVVRWLPSTTENAVGPHIHDPRSGEIIEADIQFYHNVMNLARDWYFTQVGPLDSRAKTLPLPDDLMGRLIEYVVCHEVGHTLGFQHNMKSSSTVPADKLRDPQFLKTMGHTPSIMDYSRFNYVVQPEDKVDPNDLVPRVGAYDVFAVKWGYTPIATAKSPEEEKKTLDLWAHEQDSKPWLRFSTTGSRGADPGEETEAVGDQDAVASTALGLKNLQRVVDMLIPATTAKTGEPYDDLDELYGRLLGQWSTELSHVANIVGGFDSQEKYVGQNGVLFTPIAKPRQLQAVQFLNANAFKTPAFLIKPEILRRIEPTGVVERIASGQRRVLNSLLSSARVERLVEQEAIDGDAAYRPTDFLADVRKGVWSEVYGEGPAVIDAYRRNLQREYVSLLSERINGRQTAPDDARAFFRGELKTLDSDLKGAASRTTDRETKLHIEDIQTQIARALDPTVQAPTTGTPGRPGTGFDDDFDVTGTPDTCWPDFAIRRPGGSQ
jgi:Met-zincin/Domain of unknown function (DUF5117)/Domain of unknown function (DUF5118)